MVVQVRWTNAALSELAAIRDYALSVTPAYAERLIERLIARTDMLINFPKRAAWCPSTRTQLFGS
ncbi:MAG: type II toxin-antitoxin system RelE/ParE family toxin [Hymenobacter sp.]|nr:MAG: type II toxin-antitoxin system RelE/ParE family toxin [Hymenobacter sp.]